MAAHSRDRSVTAPGGTHALRAGESASASGDHATCAGESADESAHESEANADGNAIALEIVRGEDGMRWWRRMPMLTPMLTPMPASANASENEKSASASASAPHALRAGHASGMTAGTSAGGGSAEHTCRVPPRAGESRPSASAQRV